MNDDAQFFQNLGKEFLESMRGNIQTAIINSKQPDINALKMIGHKLKGTAPSFGFHQLAEEGVRLEQDIAKGNTKVLLATITKILGFIESYLKQ